MLKKNKTDKPYLLGKRVAFRAFVKKDGILLKQWLNNQAVNFYLEMSYRPYREKEVKDFIDKALNSDKNIVFSILEKKKKEIIGTCGLYDIDFISKRAQLNILIGEEKYLSNGYGTDAIKVLISYGFERLGLNSIYLGVNSENKRAIKSYEKSGFVYDGERRQFIFTNNRFYNMIMMSILVSEYQELYN